MAEPPASLSVVGGAIAPLDGEGGASPLVVLDANIPVYFGEPSTRPWFRLQVDLALSGLPGEAEDATGTQLEAVETFKAAEVGIGLLRRVGRHGATYHTYVAAASGAASRIPSRDIEPRQRSARWYGLGLRVERRVTNRLVGAVQVLAGQSEIAVPERRGVQIIASGVTEVPVGKSTRFVLGGAVHLDLAQDRPGRDLYRIWVGVRLGTED